jgi:hypothetical protein
MSVRFSATVCQKATLAVCLAVTELICDFGSERVKLASRVSFRFGPRLDHTIKAVNKRSRSYLEKY